MRPYSVDLRERVLGAYGRREGSIEDLGERFDIAPRSIKNWLKLMRTTGSVVPRTHGGGACLRLTPRRLLVLRRLVRDDPDATLEELAERLARATRCHVHPSTISRALADLNLPRKKKDAPRDGARPARRASRKARLPQADRSHPPPPLGFCR
jgi:transposase